MKLWLIKYKQYLFILVVLAASMTVAYFWANQRVETLVAERTAETTSYATWVDHGTPLCQHPANKIIEAMAFVKNKASPVICVGAENKAVYCEPLKYAASNGEKIQSDPEETKVEPAPQSESPQPSVPAQIKVIPNVGKTDQG